VKNPNFDLMHSISFFSQFVFDEFIAKGGEYVHKVGRTLANRVVEKSNMINVYLRGGDYIESVSGSLIQREFLSLILSFSLPFLWFCSFSFFLLPLIDDLLWFLGLLDVLHVSWIQNSNFVLFVVNILIKGDIEKPSSQYLGLIMMSH
jgi:hypothetical protein